MIRLGSMWSERIHYSGFLIVLLFYHGSAFLDADFCPLLHGTCLSQCDDPASHPLDLRSYLCGGVRHCCVNKSNIISEGGATEQPPVQPLSVDVGPKVFNVATTTATTATDKAPTQPQCGVPVHSRVRRVVGGVNADRCQFPWIVFVSRGAGQNDFCGAALVSDRHVITAAHCFQNLNGYQPELTVAEYNRQEADVKGTSKYVTKDYTVHIHPQYNRFSYNNDMAVLTLTKAIPMDQYECMSPICLPENGQQNFSVGTTCTVAGWGSMSRDTNPIPSTVLVKADVTVVKDQHCTNHFGFLFKAETQICAGDIVTTADSCQGDSGGPLMCGGGPNDGPALFLAGVISSGANPCGQVGVPAIYTDVLASREWIRTIMGGTGVIG